MTLAMRDLTYMRVGWQKVCDEGRYCTTIYVFRDGDRISGVTNRNSGVGELIETITQRPLAESRSIETAKQEAAVRGSHGLGPNAPAEFGVTYEGTGKL